MLQIAPLALIFSFLKATLALLCGGGGGGRWVIYVNFVWI
jgi:hypothetical protein